MHRIIRNELPVLIAEDETNWKTLLSELVRELKLQVHIVSSYGEALGELRRRPFRAAIIDLKLIGSDEDGELHGWKLLEVTHPAGIPTMVVTAYPTTTRTIEAYEQYGVVSFMDKNAFDRENFKAVLRDAIVAREGSQPLVTRIAFRARDIAESVLDEAIAVAFLALAAVLVGTLTGWLPDSPYAYIVGSIIVAAALVGLIVWLRRRTK